MKLSQEKLDEFFGNEYPFGPKIIKTLQVKKEEYSENHPHLRLSAEAFIALNKAINSRKISDFEKAAAKFFKVASFSTDTFVSVGFIERHEKVNKLSAIARNKELEAGVRTAALAELMEKKPQLEEEMGAFDCEIDLENDALQYMNIFYQTVIKADDKLFATLIEIIKAFNAMNAAANLYNTHYLLHKNNGEIRIEYLKEAEELLDHPKVENNIKYNIYHNLASSMECNNFTEAIEYFDKAAMANPLDCSANLAKLRILQVLGKNEEYLAELEKISDPTVKELARLKLHCSNAAQFRKAISESPSMKLAWEKYRDKVDEQDGLQGIIDCIRIVEAVSEKNIAELESLACGRAFPSLHQIVVHLAEEGKALEASQIASKALSLHPDLTKTKARKEVFDYAFFEMHMRLGDFSSAEACVVSINEAVSQRPKSNILDIISNELNSRFFKHLASSGNYSKALEYLEYLPAQFKEFYQTRLSKLIQLESDMEMFDKILVELICEVVEEVDLSPVAATEPKEEAKQPEKPPEEEHTLPLREAPSLPGTLKEFAYLLEVEELDFASLSPMMMQAYFKHVASSAKAKPMESLGSLPKWGVPNCTFTYGKSTSKYDVVKLPIPNFYATIDPDLDFDHEAEFLTSLELGRIARAKNQQGIKFCGSKLVELKILGAEGVGDLRLYTSSILKNVNGENLIVFDHFGNHKDVEKAVSHSAIQVMNLGLESESSHDSFYDGEEEKAQAFYQKALGEYYHIPE